MGMNRRNVLIGLGAATAGGGALFATGAFTTVEAERTVSVDTAGDDAALLQLTDGGSALVGTESVDGDDILQIDETDLNQNALTRADGAIDVENTGDNDVGFYVESDTDVGDGELLDFQEGGSSIVGTGNSIDLTASGGSASIDVVIDLKGDENTADDIPTDVTFVADADEYSGA